METPTPRVCVCSLDTRACKCACVRVCGCATPLEPSLRITAHPPLSLHAACFGQRGILAPSREREAHATHRGQALSSPTSARQ